MPGRQKSLEIQPVLIQNIHWGLEKSLLLSAAVELDLFTSIHQGNETVEKVARAQKLPLRSTRMMLDALVGMGLLAKVRGMYRLEPEAKAFLVKGENDYMGSFLLFNEGMAQSWFKLSDAVKNGKPPANGSDLAGKKEFFKDLVKRIFPISYSSSLILSKKIGIGKSLKGQKILDVGCGSAAWSIGLALTDPTSQVVALDYPEVLEVTKNFVQRFRLQKQYEFVGADYHQHQSATSSFDIVLLGHVCHLEGEANTRKLFKKYYDALKPGGKLIVADFIPNDLRTGDELPLLFALNMLLFSENGDVFTEKEYKRWLNFAGFKKVSHLLAQYPVSLMVATK